MNYPITNMTPDMFLDDCQNGLLPLYSPGPVLRAGRPVSLSGSEGVVSMRMYLWLYLFT